MLHGGKQKASWKAWPKLQHPREIIFFSFYLIMWQTTNSKQVHRKKKKSSRTMKCDSRCSPSHFTAVLALTNTFTTLESGTWWRSIDALAGSEAVSGIYIWLFLWNFTTRPYCAGCWGVTRLTYFFVQNSTKQFCCTFTEILTLCLVYLWAYIWLMLCHYYCIIMLQLPPGFNVFTLQIRQCRLSGKEGW